MRSLLCSLALASSAALAQSGELLSTEPVRGILLPPTSPALVDDATALTVNPGALTRVGAAQLLYAHEHRGGADADGFYLGTRLGGLATGFSAEWVRDAAAPNSRKLTWGLALGTQALSLGLGWSWWQSEELAEVSGMETMDLGLLSRPAEYLSIGALVHAVNAPTRSGIGFPRTYGLAVGLRPFGEILTVGADYRAPENDLAGGVLQYTAGVKVWRGIHLFGSAAHRPARADVVSLQLGLTLDLDHLGVSFAGGGSSGGRDTYTVLARASAERYPSIPRPGGKVVMFDLADLLGTGVSPAASLLGVAVEDPFTRVIQLLDAAAKDSNIRAVILKVDGLPGTGLGKMAELREAVLRLRHAGKPVWAVLLDAADSEYFLSTAADRIYATPQSFLAINGLAAHATFFGGTMEKIGVTWDVARVGAYKNAPDQYTRTQMSPEQREATGAYVDAEERAYEAAVLQSRKLTRDAFVQALSHGLLAASEAKKAGLIDEVTTAQGLEDLIEKQFPGAAFEPRYSRKMREEAWGTRRRIAVVPVLGDITAGKSRRTPLGNEMLAGAETVVRALERAQEDPRVAAIVLRVDSPGGSVLPSDLMYRAVLAARERKPVVASMGDVAASGGYYVAAGADEILASPTTLTGSIGVFVLKPALEGLAAKLGISREAIAREGRPDILDPYHSWTDDDRAEVQRWVDDSYQQFIGIVAERRRLTREQVDQMARGRIWSGEDAKARKLIDGFGGLTEAIAEAKKRAGVPGSERLDVVVYGEPHGFLAALGGEEGVLAPLLLGDRRDPLPPPLDALLRELGTEAAALREPGVQAHTEYSVEVK